jgi:hypothetical protein
MPGSGGSSYFVHLPEVLIFGELLYWRLRTRDGSMFLPRSSHRAN